MLKNPECSCENCKLKSLFFGHVTVEALSGICDIKEERFYSKGGIITSEGDDINEFLYMKEGLVKLSKLAPEGKEQIISFSKPFDFVSLLSVFSSKTYQYSVTAVEDTVICVLNLEVVMDIAKTNAKFTLDLMKRVSETSDKIILDNLEIKRKHLRGRIAHVLMYFSQHIYDNYEFELPVSRREIADFIGMTTENVIRTLSEFRKDKIIKIYGKEIVIADPQRLENISKHG